MKKNKILFQRIIYSGLLLFLLQLGRNVLLPGMKVVPLSNSSENQFLEFITRTTGGDFFNPSFFSLGMGPYMTALIIWTTLTVSEFDWIKNLSERAKGYFQRGLTFVFAVIQAMIFLPKLKAVQDFGQDPTIFHLSASTMTILYLITGGMFLSWLADRNCENGIGGQSLFIVPSVMANIPAMLVSGKTGKVSFQPSFLLILSIVTIVFVVVTIFLYNSEYRINIERIGVTSEFTHSYIPIRLLTSGAMPFMFAVTFFSLPNLLLMNEKVKDTIFSYWLSRLFSYNTVEGIFTYGVVIYLLALSFSFINVRPYDIAKNLRESGDYVLGLPPGNKTQRFFTRKVWMISSIGSLYLVLVSMIPLFIGLKNDLYSNLSFYFGSIFMLIIILENITKEVKFIYQMENYTIFQKKHH
ncbi:preprotein translocase subunit SecY [Pilibacter termitis]|uniref:Preprotein translocase subunit SecY n=1 Tax=Pilibacter termitis TaxID=263852 RepID=A0A1T4NSM0_9ENTE|nr:accessory Sec system protein translocase subunit SecY2 [Pilibacter termitis]SJZ82299.1 preprotein translocase subunit SecY [Pilibacter termitis]